MATVMETRYPSVSTAELEAMLSTPSTKESVIVAISEEADVSHRRAKSFTSWIDRRVKRARRTQRWVIHLSAWDIRRRHDILLAIAPDGDMARPGSAHAMLEQLVLDPSKWEAHLIHGSTSEKPRDCTVTIKVTPTC